MEKIRIQFNESEYQIYHNYCLRYYNVYNTTRKRSIYLFMELFEKDILPVGEHELKDAFSFFSKKCDELQGDNILTGKSNSFADFPQFQICRDIQSLIEDFEKIYRLIDKAGISANYLLVLATFSKIIEEEKRAYISAINEQDRKKIESSAPGIAGIIRTRLGPEAEWEPVLYELTRIVRRFNATFLLQKIDRNCLSLIGPAVVAHFNVAVDYEKIQATLEKYFEESELAEFESMLNNVPYLQDNDTVADTGDSVIFEALKSISGRDVEEGYHTTTPDSGLFETADLPAVISSSVISRNSEAITPFGRTGTLYPGKNPETFASRFAIDVGDTVKSLVIIPEKNEDTAYYRYTKPGIPQYSIMVMGIVILILFAVTMAATSGIWNPVNATHNTSTGIMGNVSNPVLLQKNAPVYLQSPPQKVEPVNVIEEKKNSSAQAPAPIPTITSGDINKHFMRVAFGANTIIKKFPDDRIVIAMTGNYDDADIATVQDFISQFNNASTTNKIHDGVKFSEQASIVMNLLPESAIQGLENPDATVISKNPDTGDINYLHKTETIQFVSRDVVIVNSDFKGDERKHWVLRSLLSELGFLGETNDYPDSIFYDSADNTTRLSEIDLKALEIMYSKKVTTGMTFDRARSLLMV